MFVLVKISEESSGKRAKCFFFCFYPDFSICQSLAFPAEMNPFFTEYMVMLGLKGRIVRAANRSF